MRPYGAASWGLPAAAAALVGGAGAVWLGIGPGQMTPNAAMLALGTILIVAGLAMMALAAWARTRRDAVDRKLHKYGCAKCGYDVHLADLETGEEYPCPICSRPIYEHA